MIPYVKVFYFDETLIFFPFPFLSIKVNEFVNENISKHFHQK